MGPFRLAVLACAVAGTLAVVDGVWSAVTAATSMIEARDRMATAARGLLSGRVDAAGTEFRLAEDAARRADAAMHRPGIGVADLLPFVGDDVDAVQALASASVEVAASGRALVQAARDARWEGRSVPGLLPGGGVDLPVLEAAGPSLATAAARITEAQALLEPFGREGLIGPLGDAVTQARTLIDERAPLVRSASDLTRLLPGLLGGQERRRYFLAMQNLSAPRGSGGFLGLYGILEADDGRVRLRRLESTGTLDRSRQRGDRGDGGSGGRGAVQAPAELRRRYARFGGLTHFAAANYSPDFPQTAEVLLDLYEQSGAGQLDGVIAADPLWLSYVLRATGPVYTRAWDSPIRSENVSTVLQHDSFLLPKKRSDHVQREIGLAVWRSVVGGPLEPVALADALTRGTEERHLQVYSRHEGEEAVVRRLGASGEVRLGDNPLFVVWQDATNSKTGYFARRETTQRVTLHPDGSATVTTEVTLRNEAPPGPPSLLLGSGNSGDPVGYFAAYVNVYLPRNAEDVRSRVVGGPSLGLVEEEFGRPVLMELLGAPAGSTATMEVSYRVSEVARRVGAAWEYRLDFLPQPSLYPESLTVDVAVPDSSEVVTSSAGSRVADTAVRFAASSTVPRSFWVRYAV